jgi:MerR family transcriptional regulator, thiopeptide resistance regulator
MERQDSSHSVGEVARLAGVTVRTLHHYDEIGLLSPSERSAAGYRRYGESDLDRLRDVLAYRELGFALEDIAAILDEPGSDPLRHLVRQRELLAGRIERLERMVAAIDRELEAGQMNIRLTPEERFEVFGDFDPDAHAEEARERWGGTNAYEQSRRRVASYGKEEWLCIKAEAEEIECRLAAELATGMGADAPAAMDLAEEHRRHIDRWFYDCAPALHVGLTQMYVDDPRFTAHYDEVAPGLAAFIRDAAAANARRSG